MIIKSGIFLAILAKRMTTCMLCRNGRPGVLGCEEHTSVLTEILREAKEMKGKLAVIWLDLANADGSMPHKLVQLTLQRFTTQNFTTSWQRLQVEAF